VGKKELRYKLKAYKTHSMNCSRKISKSRGRYRYPNTEENKE
jgi:hypothetical protein